VDTQHSTPVSLESIASLLVAIVSTGAAVRLRGRHDRIHGLIVRDVELFTSLPETSKVKARLLADIDGRIDALLDARHEERRDEGGVAAGVMFSVFTFLAALGLFRTSAPWWIDLLLWVVIMGSVPWAIGAFYDGFRKRRRVEGSHGAQGDEPGRR
jgi:hypothetical protein